MSKKHNDEETVLCPECEADITVWFYPGSPGKLYGPPEDCEEPYSSTMDIPDKCHVCGTEFTSDDKERWLEQLEERYNEKPEKEFDKYEREDREDWY